MLKKCKTWNQKQGGTPGETWEIPKETSVTIGEACGNVGGNGCWELLLFGFLSHLVTSFLAAVYFVFCVTIMVILSMLCFPSFLTISHSFPLCFRMFLLVFVWFLSVFRLFSSVFPTFPVFDFAVKKRQNSSWETGCINRTEKNSNIMKLVTIIILFL